MRNMLYCAVFFSGMSALAAEFGAARLLQMRFSSITLVWAIIISLVLVYFALGYAFGGRLADRFPNYHTFFTVIALGGISLCLVPLVAQPVLQHASLAFSEFNIAVIGVTFMATLLLFSIPVTLLAMTSPFALRLLLKDLKRAGNVAGNVSALSTFGSVLGALLPALLLFDLIGAARSILFFGLLVAAIGSVGLFFTGHLKRALLFSVATLLFIGIFFFGNFQVKTTPGQIYETESAYNYIEVVEVDQYRLLFLNEGFGVHSAYHPTEEIYYDIWNRFLAGPFFNSPPHYPEQVESIAIVGLAAGTSARLATEIFGPIPIDGFEIDPKIIETGREYFEMTMPNLKAITTDGRWGLGRTQKRYSLIIVDAYSAAYIPPNLATSEFYALVHDRLLPDGVLAVNVGRVGQDRRLINDLGATIEEYFPSLYVVDIPFSNYISIIFATKSETVIENLIANYDLLQVDEQTHHFLLFAIETTIENLAAPPSGGRVYTDDWAPVESVTNSMIVRAFTGNRPDYY